MADLRSLWRFLRRSHPTTDPPRLHLFRGRVVYDGRDFGWGAYDTGSNDVMVAMKMLQYHPRHALETVAHEYGHHLQRQHGRRFVEAKAQEFAVKAVDEWRKWRRHGRRA